MDEVEVIAARLVPFSTVIRFVGPIRGPALLLVATQDSVSSFNAGVIQPRLGLNTHR